MFKRQKSTEQAIDGYAYRTSLSKTQANPKDLAANSDKQIILDLKEFREKHWDKTLPLNEAYEKYINIYSDKGKENDYQRTAIMSNREIFNKFDKSEMKTGEEIYNIISYHTFPYCGCKTIEEHSELVNDDKRKLWRPDDEVVPKERVEELKMNNCKLCHARIFITSSGCAECKEGCPNFLKKLAYLDVKILLKEGK